MQLVKEFESCTIKASFVGDHFLEIINQDLSPYIDHYFEIYDSSNNLITGYSSPKTDIGEAYSADYFDSDKGTFEKANLRGAELDSGNLTVGSWYEISAQDGEDFTADGSPDNVVGTVFYATGTNVTLDANDKVYPIDISWTMYGSNTGKFSAGVANEAVEISYVDDDNGAQLLIRDSTDFNADLEIGRLVSLDFQGKVGAGDTLTVRVKDGSTFDILATTSNIAESFTSYNLSFVATQTQDDLIEMLNMGAGESITLDNLVLRHQTNVSTSGVRIVNARGSITEGWESIGGSFDYNDSSGYTVKIYSITASSGWSKSGSWNNSRKWNSNSKWNKI